MATGAAVAGERVNRSHQESERGEGGWEKGYARGVRDGGMWNGIKLYDAIVAWVKGKGLEGWMRVGDVVDGMGQLGGGGAFLKGKGGEFWGQ